MKIAYFLNTFPSINWGSQGTSHGIAHLIKNEYPESELIPMGFPQLNKIRILRRLNEYFLMKAILKNDTKTVIKLLNQGGISSNVFKAITHICFNGEGAIHQKSGHIPRLMGLLYLAKTQGLPIAAINQTVDFPNPNSLAAKTVCHIYKNVDFLSVREPISLEKVHSMGLEKAVLIPDAAYGLPKLDNKTIISKCKSLGIEPPYICFAGSSKLKRNDHSLMLVKKF